MNICNTSTQDLSDNHIVEILVRLPVKTIAHCKCVCRDWLNLIADSHFINLHLTKSTETFMLLDGYNMDPIAKPKSLRLVEIQDEHGHTHLHHDPIMSLDLNLAPVFQNVKLTVVGSANGLICLSGNGYIRDKIYVCNPITQEYMILPKQMDSTKWNFVSSYAFGVSSLTHEYKVLRVFQDFGLSIPVPHASIYTLGTGKWRSLTVGHVSYSIDGLKGTLLNNHVHWNIRDYEDPSQNICPFDIDNETFQLFPSPPVEDIHFDRMLGVVNGCLCSSYYARTSCEFTIMVMKEFGIKNSWQKELLISESICPNMGLLSLHGSLKDGNILMMCGPGNLFIYHPDTNTIEETQILNVVAINYHPSFVKLQNFESESVHKFLR